MQLRWISAIRFIKALAAVCIDWMPTAKRSI